MSQFDDFKTSVTNKGGKRNFRVTNSFGVYDAYKHIRKNRWYNIGRAVKEYEFYAIIRGVNKLLGENLANGISIVFPYKMGTIELRKLKRGVSFFDGKLLNTYPVSWYNTLRLWYEDKEAKAKKTLVRDEQKYVFRAHYNKFNADYENKVFYKFCLTHNIKQALKENITKGKIDTLW